MKIFVLVILILTSGFAAAQISTCDEPVWTDEFDYSGAPAADKWGYDLGGGGWGNQELENYTNSRNNSWVENGKLYIKAIKNNGTWSSARLVTRQKGDWIYGRVEVRAKIPGGRGVWAAIWMLPTDYSYGSWPNSGEIDIMEHVGYDVNRIYGTIHTGAFNHTLGTQKGSNMIVSTAYSEFHDYAIEWNEEKILLFVDDKLYYTFNNLHKTSREWPFDKRFHLIMNIAVGGSWGGAQGIDPNLSEAVMEIEHVRIFKLKPDKPVVEGPGVVNSGQEVTFSVKKYSDVNYVWSVPEDASIVSGQGTSQLSLKWGQTPGEIRVELQSKCDTLLSDPFSVNLLSDLQTLKIENFDSDTFNWKINSTLNNIVSFEREGEENLRVNFDIQTPTNNPSIEYTFESLQNLKDYSRMVLSLKTEPGKAPSNLRIDLIDDKDLVETDNLFKIDQFNTSGNFETYAHTFGVGTTTQFNIQKIKRIRIYFNYGMYGLAGSGFFTFSPIEMKNKITSVEIMKTGSLLCRPNPATNFIFLDKPYLSVSIYSEQGTLVYMKNETVQSKDKIEIGSLPSGVYLLRAMDSKNVYCSKFIKSH
jgi:beta-glucanase (GH16 family)